MKSDIFTDYSQKISPYYIRQFSFGNGKSNRNVPYAKITGCHVVLENIDEYGDHDYISVCDIVTGKVVQNVKVKFDHKEIGMSLITRCLLNRKIPNILFYASARKFSNEYMLENICMLNLESGVATTFDTNHTSMIYGFTLSSDERFLASCDIDGNISILDVDTKKVYQEILAKQGAFDLSFSPCGRFLSVANAENNIVQLFNVKNGKHIRDFICNDVSQTFLCVKFSPCGSFIFAGSNYDIDFNSKIIQWNVNNGEIVNTFPNSLYDVDAIDISPDGKHLVGAFNSMIGLWNIEIGKLICGLEGKYNGILKDVSFSNDGTIIRSVDSNGNVNFFNIEGL